MKNLIEITDDALNELNKKNIDYKMIKESKSFREEMLKKAGFNPEDLVYNKNNNFYSFPSDFGNYLVKLMNGSLTKK